MVGYSGSSGSESENEARWREKGDKALSGFEKNVEKVHPR